MRKIAHLVIGLGLGATAEQGFGPAGSATYEVTITNLTSGQPLTPPLVVTHRQFIRRFEVGEAASFGLNNRLAGVAPKNRLVDLHRFGTNPLEDARHGPGWATPSRRCRARLGTSTSMCRPGASG